MFCIKRAKIVAGDWDLPNKPGVRDGARCLQLSISSDVNYSGWKQMWKRRGRQAEIFSINHISSERNASSVLPRENKTPTPLFIWQSRTTWLHTVRPKKVTRNSSTMGSDMLWTNRNAKWAHVQPVTFVSGHANDGGFAQPRWVLWGTLWGRYPPCIIICPFLLPRIIVGGFNWRHIQLTSYSTDVFFNWRIIPDVNDSNETGNFPVFDDEA